MLLLFGFVSFVLMYQILFGSILYHKNAVISTFLRIKSYFFTINVDKQAVLLYNIREKSIKIGD